MRFDGIKANVGFKVLRLIAAVLILGGCRQKADPLGINIDLERHRLSNGLVVILAPDHTVPIVSYQTWYRVGSVDEKPGITGISHLFEHLMFKGTPRHPEKQFFHQLEARGAEVNAMTTRDYTVYYENFIPPLLEKVIDMESDRMENLRLNEEALTSERLVVFEEKKLRYDNSPEGKIQEALWQLAFRRHPYQWPIIGYPQDLLSITTEQLRNYYRAHYHPGNAALVIVGDIDPGTTLKWVKNYYGRIPGRPRPKREILGEPEQREERRLVLRDRLASERFAQAYHVTSAMEDDSYALDVLASILFEGTSSRAYRRIVEKRDLAVSIAGSAFTPAYPGLFIVSATMKGNVRGTEVEAELDHLVNEIQEGGVTPDEITVAVRQLTVQVVDSVRTPHGLGQLIGTVQTVFGDPKRFTEDLTRYTRVTAADVRRVAQRYLIPNNRSVVSMESGVRK